LFSLFFSTPKKRYKEAFSVAAAHSDIDDHPDGDAQSDLDLNAYTDANPDSRSARLFPSALCGQVGAVVDVEGENFTPSASLILTWSGLPLGTAPSPVQVDPTGRFSLSLVVPNDFAGPHLIRVSDGSRLAQFTFTLGETCQPPPPTETPTPVPSPTSTETATPTAPVSSDQPRLRCEPETAIPDQTITVDGENFHPGGHFHELRWDGVVIPWAPTGLTVGDDGKFTLWFTAPSDTYELHTLVADDGQGGWAKIVRMMAPIERGFSPLGLLLPLASAGLVRMMAPIERGQERDRR
jgi:hypothetical protein